MKAWNYNGKGEVCWMEYTLEELLKDCKDLYEAVYNRERAAVEGNSWKEKQFEGEVRCIWHYSPSLKIVRAAMSKIIGKATAQAHIDLGVV
jgi:hypothetical protein